VTGWEELERALRRRTPLRVAGGAPRAAVALVLRDGEAGEVRDLVDVGAV